MNIQTSEDKKIRQEASEWVTKLSSPNAAPEVMEEFSRWCEADPRHMKAYDRISNIYSRMGDIKDPDLLKMANPQYSEGGVFHKIFALLKSIMPSFPAPRRPLIATGALAILIIVSVVGINMIDFTSEQTFNTKTAEIRDVHLDDGSIITLGARSQIKVEFSDKERYVRLENGEAFFAVAKDENRPFFVHSNGIEIKVVGTKFNVHKGPNGLRIAVEEGIVKVREQYPLGSLKGNTDTPLTLPSGTENNSEENIKTAGNTLEGFTPKVILTAGEYITSNQQGMLSEVELYEATSQPSAWREGRLIYIDASFAELVADISRYYDGDIHLASKEVGDIRISGVFWTTKINDLIETLPKYLPVNVQHQGNKTIMIELNQGQG